MPTGIYKRKIGTRVGKYIRTLEIRKKLSEVSKGKVHSEEHNKKVSLEHLGKKRPPFSKEWRENMRKGQLGKRLSEETKRKISLTMSSPKNIQEMKKRRLKIIIPFKNTSIELKLQNWFKEQNIEFETHYPILGQPDIFIKPNICIFADGCYWHKCPECGFGELRQRDKKITEELREQGYIVYRIWEHQINNNQFTELSNALEDGEG